MVRHRGCGVRQLKPRTLKAGELRERIEQRQLFVHPLPRVCSDELGVASVNAMTFDDATQFTPQIAYFGGSAPRWCEVDPHLTAFGNTE